jgi:hypothetical protein
MNTSISEAGNDENAGGIIQVPVQEDWLFDVDILERELSPVRLISILICHSFVWELRAQELLRSRWPVCFGSLARLLSSIFQTMKITY